MRQGEYRVLFRNLSHANYYLREIPSSTPSGPGSKRGARALYEATPDKMEATPFTLEKAIVLAKAWGGVVDADDDGGGARSTHERQQAGAPTPPSRTREAQRAYLQDWRAGIRGLPLDLRDVEKDQIAPSTDVAPAEEQPLKKRERQKTKRKP